MLWNEVMSRRYGVAEIAEKMELVSLKAWSNEDESR